MDATSPNPDRYEVAILQKDQNGNVVQRKIEGEELKQIMEEGKIFEKAAQKK